MNEAPSTIGLSCSLEELRVISRTFHAAPPDKVIREHTNTTALLAIAEALTSIAESLAAPKKEVIWNKNL